MSPKSLLLTAALAAAAQCGGASPAPAQGTAPAPPAAATATEPPAWRVALLTNGQVLRGEITAEDGGYLVAQRLGEQHVPKKRVEKVFATIEDAYKYKRDRLPEGDPDEHLKLAQWCIHEKLDEPAKEQLRAILDLQPENRQAHAMLNGIQAVEDHARGKDAAIVRTGAEVPVPAGARPGELSPAVVRGSRPRTVAAGPPVIDGLPPALAVKRFREFASFVHPELQRHCASCHNEQHPESKFVLLQARNARQLNDPLLLRTNLDATLKLVNQEKPSRSELLVSSIIDHPSTGKPILGGRNDRAYRVFAVWVGRLQVKPTGRPGAAPDDDVRPAGFTAAAPSRSTGGFASDRAGAPAPTAPAADATPTPNAGVLPPNRSGKETTFATPPGVEIRHPSVPPDADFRTVYPLGASNPFAAPLVAGGKPVGNAPRPALPRLPAGNVPGVAGVPPSTPPRAAAPASGAARVAPKTPAPADDPKRKAKPVKLDPSNLDAFFRNRAFH
ncbi:MAG TPA: hypothetical protein VG406_26475 [Isosphaeraceae bacterium]|jgi:hypothetical protein|nr:hypothetical protein [Isosphaeraceae bacterium]